ncbi:DUF6308 family protein [Kitasatospora sp. NPDC058965]|uniref:DUF6308 family protein n=1 Tax=Kitasatospora sp. NPDC058965 TaxID=3346682 RepID=UPI003686767D
MTRPDTASEEPFTHRLLALLHTGRAVDDLRRYFGMGTAPGVQPFTGSRFEHLGGGGDRPHVADRVTAEDLVAVQTLSVTVPAPVALDILEGSLGTELSRLLREIPTGIDMADVDPSLLGPGSPADQAWHLLCGQHEVGRVIAGKLLARKRPRLLPVYDRVVRCAVGRPSSFWLSLHAALREDGGALHDTLTGLRRAAGLPESVSALRVCDVIVWMGHRALRHNCPR